MAHAQKPDFVFRRNGLVHLNRRRRQFSRLLADEVSNAGYTTFRGSVRVLATHSIRQFPLNFPSRASPCVIRFQTHFTKNSVTGHVNWYLRLKELTCKWKWRRSGFWNVIHYQFGTACQLCHVWHKNVILKGKQKMPDAITGHAHSVSYKVYERSHTSSSTCSLTV